MILLILAVWLFVRHRKKKMMQKAVQPVVIVQTSSPQRVSMLKVLIAAILLKKIIGVPATHQ